MIRRLVILLAILLAPAAHARPVVWGGTPCTNSAANTDGCYNGGSIRVPTFFKGYASQSRGISVPAQTYQALSYPTATSLQPAVYPNRPGWNVAGVDYAVGMPNWQMPTLSNLHPAYLKDPAQIATDVLVNPLGHGENCQFYASNTAYSGGVGTGTTAAPSPSSFGGPFIMCNSYAGSVKPLIFDGYNFGWNSATGWNCVQIIIKGNAWGTGAANTSAATANIVFRNSLFLNGPNCNIYGGVGQGSGTTSAGPMVPDSAFQLQVSGSIIGNTVVANSLGFYNNTVYGCGGDSNATALETALCSQTFNATSYAAGSISTFINGAKVGVAPVDNAVAHYNGNGSLWIENNAFLHIPGRVFLNNYNNITTHVEYNDHNYYEGFVYYQPQWAQVSSVVCSANCASPALGSPTTETVTTLAPHGIPVGSYASVNFNSAAGGWSSSWSMQATDATHLVFNSTTNPGDYVWASGAYPTIGTEPEHAEIQEDGYSENIAATYTGSITGNTLTVSSVTSGAVAVGQYVTANSGADATITGSIGGNVLTVSSVTSGALAIGQVITGTGIPTGTVIATGSGTSWTLSQAPASAVGSETINAYITIPGGTYITAGSGSTWTLSQSLPNPVSGLMENPLGAGNTININWSYNTVLWPASQAPIGETTFYISCGAGNLGVPMCTFSGSLDHNVIVTNIANLGRPTATVNAIASINYSNYVNLSLHDNWVDPTGASDCWGTEESDYGSNVTFANNTNLLNAADPYVNAPQSASIIPFSAGTSAFTQAESGVSYNSTTGVITVTTNLPLPATVGEQVELEDIKVSQGYNYLVGFFNIASISGNTFTVQGGTGYPGVMISPSPGAILADGNKNPLICSGHN